MGINDCLNTYHITFHVIMRCNPISSNVLNRVQLLFGNKLNIHIKPISTLFKNTLLNYACIYLYFFIE